MIDSHCHLDHCPDPVAAADLALRAMISVGTTVERNRETLQLAERLPNVWAAVGIHPNNASDAVDPQVRRDLEEQALQPHVVAIGETGFDTHWDDESLASQRSAFDWQAELAARLDLPLILHVRDRQGGDDASREASRAMREAGHAKGVLHCFNGDRELLETGLELGWMVSFAGNLTYPSARKLQESAPHIPDERLLVETDSPFLAPVPERGRRNTPAFVRHTAGYLARLRGVTLERLEELTDTNAIRFYRLPL
ncbi:MAG: TatD family hydrolase [Trueperaceae bacterium]